MTGVDASQLAAYVSVTLLLVITPGSTTTVVIRNTLRGGQRAGVLTASGAGIANIAHGAAAGLGLALLFQQRPAIVPIVRASGAAYLLWLAYGSLAHAWRGGRRLPARVDHAPDEAPGRPFRDGLLVNLMNPPIITFYLMVPTFLRPGGPPAMFAALAAIHVSMAFACHVAWALAFGQLRARLGWPQAMRWLDAGAGVGLMVLAVRSVV